MYACQYVGIDDPARQRTLPIDRINRQLAIVEVDDVVELFNRFKAGDPTVGDYAVQPDRLGDRLDVKSCCAVTDRMLPYWQERGVPTSVLRELLLPVIPAEEDIITLGQDNEEVTYLVVGYDGFARAGTTIDTADIGSGGTLTRVHEGQIVISHINAVNGSICVVPSEYDGYVITSEYSAFDHQATADPWVLWTILRSPEIRAEFLVRASGVGRTRVDWDTIAEVSVPTPGPEISRSITSELEEANRLLAEVEERRTRARQLANETYGLASDEAQAILRRFKPPK